MQVTVTVCDGQNTHSTSIDIDDVHRLLAWIKRYEEVHKADPLRAKILHALERAKRPLSRREIAMMIGVEPNHLESTLGRMLGKVYDDRPQTERVIHVAAWIYDPAAGHRLARIFDLGGDEPDEEKPPSMKQRKIQERQLNDHINSAVARARSHAGNPFGALIK